MRFIIIILILISYSLHGQFDFANRDTTINKLNNTELHFGFGHAIPLAPVITLSGHFEFNILMKSKLRTNMKLAYGFALGGDYNGGGESHSYFSIAPIWLIGKEKSFFEFHFGIGVIEESRRSDAKVIPVFGIGSRFYRGNNVFRFNVGFPELLGGSIGFRF